MGSLGITLCGVKFKSFNLSGESLKVRIDDERGRQILVVVLEGELLFPLFWHLHPHSSLAYPTTLGSMGFQQNPPCVAVQAVTAEVLALLVLALVMEQAVEVFDPGVVNLADLLDQQEIDSAHSLRLGAEPLNIHTLNQPNTLMARLFKFSIFGI